MSVHNFISFRLSWWKLGLCVHIFVLTEHLLLQEFRHGWSLAYTECFAANHFLLLEKTRWPAPLWGRLLPGVLSIHYIWDYEVLWSQSIDSWQICGRWPCLWSLTSVIRRLVELSFDIDLIAHSCDWSQTLWKSCWLVLGRRINHLRHTDKISASSRCSLLSGLVLFFEVHSIVDLMILLIGLGQDHWLYRALIPHSCLIGHHARAHCPLPVCSNFINSVFELATCLLWLQSFLFRVAVLPWKHL